MYENVDSKKWFTIELNIKSTFILHTYKDVKRNKAISASAER